MGFINLGRLNIRKKKLVRKRTRFISDVQPPSVYKSHILNGPINKLYIFFKEVGGGGNVLASSTKPETKG